MDSFAKRVCQLQSGLKVPKEQTNKFGGYKYRSCEDILEAAKPLLSELGLVLTLSDSVIQIGSRYYIQAEASLRDTDSDAILTNTAYAREPDAKKGMDDSQITGTASSYARKYALNGLLCIDDTKDADTDEFHMQQSKNNARQLVCSDCGKEIVRSKKRDGSEWNALDIAGYSQKKFGRCLCPGCQRKEFEKQKATTP